MTKPPTILRITAYHHDRCDTIELPLSSSSCWSRFFGSWALPCQGSIDQLNAFFANHEADRITLIGCPSACLLPILWMRTIWFAHTHPSITIDWPSVENPANDQARQASGKLACMLADEIRCPHPEDAWALWGIQTSATPKITEEAFDLLTNIVDLWDTDLAHMTLASDWCESMRRALINCSSLNQNRVALYGGGTHTRGIGDAIMEPNTEIVCIIDDDTRRHGQRLWGYEIVSREQALDMNLDAIILSANSIENQLWQNASVFRDRGVPTYQLYSGHTENESKETLHANS